MAAPHVTGLAGLLLSKDPTLTATELKDIILYTAEDVNAATLPGVDVQMGHGRINANKALTCFGTLNANTTWDREFSIYDDVTIASGYTLTIEEDSYITIPSGKTLQINSGANMVVEDGAELVVNGVLRFQFNSDLALDDQSTLTVDGGQFIILSGSQIELGDDALIECENSGQIVSNGQSTNRITFTSIYENNFNGEYWSKIHLKSSASSNNVIHYTDFMYGNYGVYCEDNSPTIEYCTFSNNNTGFGAYNGSPELTDNTFTDNNNYGVWLYGAYLEPDYPYLENNEFYGNGNTAVVAQNYAKPTLVGNEVYNNTSSYGGVRVVYGSIATLTENDIYGNTYGLSTGSPVASSINAGTSHETGHNFIRSNSVYDIYTCGSQVTAQYNYWDNPQFYECAPGQIDASNGLRPPTRSTQSDLSADNGEPTTREGTNDVHQLWTVALQLLESGNLNGAIPILENLVNRFGDTPQGQTALVHLFHIYQQTDSPGFGDFLLDLLNDLELNETLRTIAYELLANNYMAQSDFANAASIYQDLAEWEFSTESRKYALFHLYRLYSNHLDDPAQAAIALSALQTDYPNDELTQLANSLSGLSSQTSGSTNPSLPGGGTIQSPRPLSSATRLEQNYPNPFNPTTTISYQLAQPSQVNLKVYNTSGQLVKSLVNGQLSSGQLETVWDGRNETGQAVGSGIYFYRLTTENGYDETRSMILLK